jgi:hypothetical protein
VEWLSADQPALKELYTALVEKLWNPAFEKKIRSNPMWREFYSKLPAMLWDALAPKSEAAADAQTIICNILWAMTKERTWKVSADGGQSAPRVWDVWRCRYSSWVSGPRDVKTYFSK